MPCPRCGAPDARVGTWGRSWSACGGRGQGEGSTWGVIRRGVCFGAPACKTAGDGQAGEQRRNNQGHVGGGVTSRRV